MSKFGDKFTKLRTGKEFSLRKFCLEMGIDPGNWSRIERGLANPPQDFNFYLNVKEVLSLTESEVDEIHEVACMTNILPRCYSDNEILDHLPVFLRRADGEEITEEDCEKIVKWIRSDLEDKT